jgi:putative GTP pyrophosphokinase
MDIGAYIEQNRQALATWGEDICRSVCEQYGTLLKVPAAVRVKDPDSARKKQFKKAYADPQQDMTDLVGVRFVVLTSDDLMPIRRHLEGSTAWQCLKARDPDQEIEVAPDTFGYQSHHYEIRPLASAEPWCCEVQVRTLLQHTIAELSHDAMYKATQAVPSQALRLVARSMALMETTDELLCRAMQAVREAEAPALAVRRVACDLARSIDGGDTGALLEDLLAAYSGIIDGASGAQIKAFVGDHDYIFDKIRSRPGDGLFGFHSAAILTYWLVSRLERKAMWAWPFPGSKGDLNKVFSDLGISPG